MRLEVFHHLLAALCEEAGALLRRSAISPNIRARRDYSFALFDANARLVAQAAHIPVHLGSAREAVLAAQRAHALRRGDVVLLNDPFAGGTHLPDLTLVRPVFVGRGARPRYFAVCRAHHADVGGATPGSMGVATELLAEGLVLPPVLIRAGGEPVRDVLSMIAANVRGAAERMVDLQAQEAALLLAERRLLGLIEEHGARTVEDYCGFLMDYTERLVAHRLAALPAGRHRARDALDDDGMGGGPLPVCVTVEIGDGRVVCDFAGTAPQARAGVNANPGIALAACLYVVRALCGERVPTNDGLYRRVLLRTPPGSLVDPNPPAPVAGGNVETSQRLVDVVIRAFARACPRLLPAASAGTMSNLSIGGVDGAGREFAFYETLPGGAGAAAARAGVSAVQTHMTNTANTPVEELEHRLPLRVRRLTVRRGSGGSGRHRGGDGLIKELEVVRGEMTCTLLAERHTSAPQGLGGGGAARPGAAFLTRGGRRRRVPAKSTHTLGPGDVVLVETPGGGGWGRA